jgi:glycosyltransferase involved in cell wall biosynthesis
MKKIVIDARGFSGSNGEYVQNLLEQLDIVDNNLSHRYVVLMNPKDMDNWSPKSKRFTKVPSRVSAYTLTEQFGLAWQLYRQNANLVHFTSPNQPLLYLRNKVTTIHDLNMLRFRSQAKHKFANWAKHKRKIWTHKFAIRTSKTIITPSDYIKLEVAKYAHANSRRISVIYNAADQLAAGAQPLDIIDGKQFILYLGRPAVYKNLGKLIDAFELLKEKHPDLQLVLAGRRDGLYKHYERLVGKRDLDEHVIFTDYVTDGNLRWLYENCVAFVVPSLSEGFGLPGLEAMQHGAAVVSSNTGALPEVYGDAAEYFDPENAEDIAAKIRRVINNTEKRADLVKLGKRQTAKYSWKRTAEQTLAIYKSALKEK